MAEASKMLRMSTDVWEECSSKRIVLGYKYLEKAENLRALTFEMPALVFPKAAGL
jgi:hypothetical protein